MTNLNLALTSRQIEDSEISEPMCFVVKILEDWTAVSAFPIPYVTPPLVEL